MNEYRYAVVDRAVVTHILTLAEEHDADAWCVFLPPVDDAFAQVAPYLVELPPALEDHLQARREPWGFAFTTEQPAKVVLNHLRALLSVYKEGNPTPTFCRYYDPRIIWALLDACKVPQQYYVFGPIKAIRTWYPQAREMALTPIKVHRPLTELVLSDKQYQAVLDQCLVNLKQDVQEILQALPTPASDGDPDRGVFADTLVTQLTQWGVTVVTDIKTIASLCVSHNVSDWEALPATWHAELSHSQLPGSYRVKTLVAKLGGQHEL
ncbi:DUF4123 domain-containing protein [Salinivibrio socompensis]|uniref:DUF4123 domain-containing protein n=1 Tax=Salinivibrio socompensis TaxID=1510206 RepID=UPI00046F4478|nr:DUF4123 domain-containing protein [Salinivibrio socompensis]